MLILPHNYSALSFAWLNILLHYRNTVYEDDNLRVKLKVQLHVLSQSYLLSILTKLHAISSNSTLVHSFSHVYLDTTFSPSDTRSVIQPKLSACSYCSRVHLWRLTKRYDIQEGILSHGTCPWFNIVSLNLVLKAAADADWSEKYRRRSKGLPKKTVILYGRQILKVIWLL